jgi:hypothetical protein
MRKTILAFGGEIRVIITSGTSAGVECRYDRQRNYGGPDYLIASGYGETEALAVSDYLRVCRMQEDAPYAT